MEIPTLQTSDSGGIVTLNIICAWCGQALRYDPRLQAGDISHGICPSCVAAELAQLTFIPQPLTPAEEEAARRWYWEQEETAAIDDARRRAEEGA